MEPRSGRLEVITGPMFAQKTKSLIERLRVAERSGKVRAFKPNIDKRYSTNALVSHDGERYPARPIDSLVEIEDGFPIIGIDEIQFFGSDTVEDLKRLVQAGTRVIVAGLNYTFKGEPFHPVPALMHIADDVVELSARCAKCGKVASRTHRRVHNDSTVLVGGSEAYEPRCLTCFDPNGG
jgi:thymidine kinase